MKRAAAITGPTPSFIRWAIQFDCPFRQNDDEDLPYQTFRQLRSLREVSIGRLEQRIVDGICIHGDLNESSETARGFPVDEVLAFFGDEDHVQNVCGLCSANPIAFPNFECPKNEDSNQKRWAGCYGWFRSAVEKVNLIDAVEKYSAESKNRLPKKTKNTQRIWFELWQTERWDVTKLDSLKRCLGQIPESFFTAHSEFADFVRAVDVCYENQLELVTELIPRGNSDGLHWRIESHCSICRCEMGTDGRKCCECGNVGHPVPPSRRKVLGLRPYMLLRDLVGLKKATDLLDKYHRKQK